MILYLNVEAARYNYSPLIPELWSPYMSLPGEVLVGKAPAAAQHCLLYSSPVVIGVC